MSNRNLETEIKCKCSNDAEARNCEENCDWSNGRGERKIVPPPPAGSGKSDETIAATFKFNGEKFVSQFVNANLKEINSDKFCNARLSALEVKEMPTIKLSDEEIFYIHFDDEEMSEGFVELKTKDHIKDEILSAMSEARISERSEMEAEIERLQSQIDLDKDTIELLNHGKEIPDDLRGCRLNEKDLKHIYACYKSSGAIAMGVEEKVLGKVAFLLRERDVRIDKFTDTIATLMLSKMELKSELSERDEKHKKETGEFIKWQSMKMNGGYLRHYAAGNDWWYYENGNLEGEKLVGTQLFAKFKQETDTKTTSHE